MKELNVTITRPCYFKGSHYPVIAIPLYKTMKTGEIIHELEKEFDITCTYLQNNKDYSEEDIKLFVFLFKEYIKELRQSSDSIFVNTFEINETEENDPIYLYIHLQDI